MGNFFSRRVGDSRVPADVAELDELYHFIGKRAKTKTKENLYILTSVTRKPRQFIGILASRNKHPNTIEKMVQEAPHAKQYFSDGYQGYAHVDYFPGVHKFSERKNDTFTVEGANADLRTYIPTLQRKSRCFPRKLENLNAVLKLFAHAYTLYGQWKLKTRTPVKHKSETPNKKLRKFKYPQLSHLDFLFVH